MRSLPLVFLALIMPVAAALGQSRPAMTDPGNPFFETWNTPFGVPPFDRIRVEHYRPAFDEAIARQRREVEAIANRTDAPTFANTVEALDASGALLDRVNGVFDNLLSAESDERLQQIATDVAPLLSALQDDILLNERLFARLKAVYDRRDAAGLDAEQRRLVEETYKRFVRGGANLTAEQKARLRAINEELSLLNLRFSDNLLAETNAYRLVVEREADLAGLPANAVAAAAEAADGAGLQGRWLFTLQAPSLWPFLSYADNRDLRRQMLTAYFQRGANGNDHDNRDLIRRTVALRAERARLLGYDTFADFVLEERMARTPKAVYDLLGRLWTPALNVARRERDDLQTLARSADPAFRLEPWDWRYYAERVKRERFDLDENELSQYFALDRVREGAFYTANQLYGITFTERTDLPKYHEEVRTFEVKDADGSHLGVFYVDYHPRPGKRGGAWQSEFRSQRFRDGKDVRPVVVNVCNFTRPSGDMPALLTLDEVETLFHEFGHALHALFSRVHYAGVGGVPRDFVELPSQIMEHWATRPEVLRVYARHYRTGETIPQSLLDRIEAAGKFNQGFATVEYLAASLLDMDWHTRPDAVGADPEAFEKASMDRLGLIPEIAPRYKTPYFLHIFSHGYSAGYYSYIWSEVLDTDAFEAFKEHGIFDRATATSFRRNILERGGSADAMEMYRAFRGREPVVEPLLRQRGLD